MPVQGQAVHDEQTDGKKGYIIYIYMGDKGIDRTVRMAIRSEH